MTGRLYCWLVYRLPALRDASVLASTLGNEDVAEGRMGGPSGACRECICCCFGSCVLLLHSSATATVSTVIAAAPHVQPPLSQHLCFRASPSPQKRAVFQCWRCEPTYFYLTPVCPGHLRCCTCGEPAVGQPAQGCTCVLCTSQEGQCTTRKICSKRKRAPGIGATAHGLV